MYWNRFDICEAWFLYASHYHSGQSSCLYEKFAQLDRIGFSPSPLLTLESLNNPERANVKEIYLALVENN